MIVYPERAGCGCGDGGGPAGWGCGDGGGPGYEGSCCDQIAFHPPDWGCGGGRGPRYEG